MNCPHCGEEVDEVMIYVHEQNEYHVYIDRTGSLEWENQGIVEKTEKQMDAECVSCQGDLGTWRPNGRCTVDDKSFWNIDYYEWVQKLLGNI